MTITIKIDFALVLIMYEAKFGQSYGGIYKKLDRSITIITVNLVQVKLESAIKYALKRIHQDCSRSV